MAKFKVGDMVKGISDKYTCTNEDMTAAEVVDVNSDFDYITVKITEHLTNKSMVGREFMGLCPEDFERIPKFKSGDRVTPVFNDKIYTLVGRRPSADEIGFGFAWDTEEGGWLGEDQIELVEDEPKKTEQPKFSVGDTVKVVAEGNHFLAVGENAKITRVRGGGAYDAEGRGRGEYRIVRQIVSESDLEPAEAATPTHIRMLDGWDPGYEPGDILELVGDGHYFIDNDGDFRPISAHEFEYVDGEAKTETQERPKVGDKVRVIARHEDRSPVRHSFGIGTVVEVRDDDGGEEIPLLCKANGTTWWLDLDEVEPIGYEVTRGDVVEFLRSKDDTEILDIVQEVRSPDKHASKEAF